MIVLPAILLVVSQSAVRYPYLSYSHVLGSIGIMDYSDKTTPLTDKYGNKYTTAEADSLMPLSNFRQLMMDGRMPDSIAGQEATMRNIASRQIVVRHTPSDGMSTQPPLHLLYENMPKRVGIELPTDMIRLSGELTFIDCATLRTNGNKSDIFTRALQKSGFVFPVRASWSNDSPRKRYDEGIFCSDARGELYHLKMVNGRPFVRHVPMPTGFVLADVSIAEPSDKSFYAIAYSTNGCMGLIAQDENSESGYSVSLFDLAPVNLLTDRITFSGNLVSWTLTVVNETGVSAWAFDRQTLAPLDTLTLVAPQPTTLESACAALLPLSFGKSYVAGGDEVANVKIGPTIAWLIAIVLACVYYFWRGRRKGSEGLWGTLLVALTGPCGLIAALLIPQDY